MWKTPLTLAIAQDGIALAEKGQSIRALSKQMLNFDAATEVLDTLTAHADLLRGRNVNLVLGNVLVRYIVLPWQAHVHSSQDWLGLARHGFRQQFGAAAESWQVRVSLTQFGQPVVASAIHPALFEALMQAKAQLGLSWQSITPAIAMGQTQMKTPAAWWVMAEPGYVVLSMQQANEAQSVIALSPPAGDEYRAVSQLIARYGAQSQHPPQHTVVYVSGALTDVWRQAATTVRDDKLKAVYAKTTDAQHAAWLARMAT